MESDVQDHLLEMREAFAPFERVRFGAGRAVCGLVCEGLGGGGLGGGDDGTPRVAGDVGPPSAVGSIGEATEG